MNSPLDTLDSILRTKKLVVILGTGGVGKTTLSAATALRAAKLGRRTVVITIDPSKRLATALGIHHTATEPVDLCPATSAPLHAVIPDTRKTFENFVLSLSENPETRERIRQNPIYSVLAREFSGTNEYMALKALEQLMHDSRFDLIVLDTPPSDNALDFIHSPTILSQFFEDKLVRWLTLPANRIVSATMKKALQMLESLTGSGFMSHLLDFATTLFEVQTRFASTLKNVKGLLQSSETAFVLATSSRADAAAEMRYLVEGLAHWISDENKAEHPIDLLILNRCIAGYFEPPPPATFMESEAGQWCEHWRQEEVSTLNELRGEFQEVPVLRVRERIQAVHTLEGVCDVAQFHH